MSLSINTNQSSMVALETLNATQTDLAATESAVSTGKKVSNASDNPAAFGIAAQIGGDIAGQTAVNDGLSYAAQVVGTTNSAANSILDVLKNVQNAVTTVGNNLGNKTSLGQLNKEITGYLNQINTIARNATVKGVNLLSGGVTDGNGIDTNSMTYVSGVKGDTQTLTSYSARVQADVQSLSGSSSSGSSTSGSSSSSQPATLTDALGLTSGSTANEAATGNIFFTSGSGSDLASAFTSTSGGTTTYKVPDMIKAVQNAITAMTNVTSDLGSNTQTIATMSSFGQKVSDSLTAASGALTDADMSAESAKLTSLQTKQSLGIKSLSIANGQSQNILSLFQ